MAHEQRRIIRLLVLDNRTLYREALAHLLSDQPALEAVSHEPVDGQTLPRLKQSMPDVILLGFEWGDQRPLQFLQALRIAGCNTPVVALADNLESVTLRHAAHLKLNGVCLGGSPAADLVLCICEVARGQMWFDERYAALAVRALRDPATLDCQFDAADILLMRGLVSGKSNREIGRELGIGEGPTKWRVRRLMKKAGVHSRVELVRVAMERFPGRI